MGFGLRHVMITFMETHAGEVLEYGVELGSRTWAAFLSKFGWRADYLDKVICHQVGAGHRDAVLAALGIAPEKDYSTFPFLGNIGTVSLPLTAALAEEREFLRPGDRVGFLGIGSGLNCLMLGVEWQPECGILRMRNAECGMRNPRQKTRPRRRRPRGRAAL